jgi:hypothetical protein
MRVTSQKSEDLKWTLPCQSGPGRMLRLTTQTLSKPYSVTYHDLRTVYDKGPCPLRWAGSRAACRKLTVRGIPNRLNCGVTFIACPYFTTIATGLIIQASWQRVGDPRSRAKQLLLMRMPNRYSRRGEHHPATSSNELKSFPVSSENSLIFGLLNPGTIRV